MDRNSCIREKQIIINNIPVKKSKKNEYSNLKSGNLRKNINNDTQNRVEGDDIDNDKVMFPRCSSPKPNSSVMDTIESTDDLEYKMFCIGLLQPNNKTRSQAKLE